MLRDDAQLARVEAHIAVVGFDLPDVPQEQAAQRDVRVRERQGRFVGLVDVKRESEVRVDISKEVL